MCGSTDEPSGTEDPRDMVGKNPTGRERRSSGSKRRQENRRLDRDLEGTRWEDKKKNRGNK